MQAAVSQLFPGDLVEVRSFDQILVSLDADGTLAKLPFMPEMLEYCGKRFRVSSRASKTCCSTRTGTNMRVFRTSDVVLLDGLRCSGAAHDGCQKGCMIFWRAAWLKKVAAESITSSIDPESATRLRSRLKTFSAPGVYFCQASQLLKATDHMSRWQRLATCLSDVHTGNCSALEMARRVSIWLFWRIRRVFLGQYARGVLKSTPVESLNLQPGEWVDVKPIETIVSTLNPEARNRGLYFSPDMRLACGKRQRVDRRLDRLIVDGTGVMKAVNNTVYLEGSHCSCSHVAFGGCPRGEFVYWREIWLRRRAAANQAEETEDKLDPWNSPPESASKALDS